MECFRVSEGSLDHDLLVVTLDDPAHTRATRNNTVSIRDRAWLSFLIFLHFLMKGTEALPAPRKSKLPFPGSYPARGEEQSPLGPLPSHQDCWGELCVQYPPQGSQSGLQRGTA